MNSILKLVVALSLMVPVTLTPTVTSASGSSMWAVCLILLPVCLVSSTTAKIQELSESTQRDRYQAVATTNLIDDAVRGSGPALTKTAKLLNTDEAKLAESVIRVYSENPEIQGDTRKLSAVMAMEFKKEFVPTEQ
ncbi:MAG: hypothetical protein IT289_01585 [Oligoflexia bacterium]|nr:hypothetical protein [Oligoflexia bacterium]